MMTREQLRKAWMNAQEINYNGNTLLVVQGFDIEGYAPHQAQSGKGVS